MVARGEVWLARMDDSRADGERTLPCLIVSPPELHDHLSIVIVAPIAARAPAGFRVNANIGGEGSRILLEQVRAIDKQRLLRQVGTAERKALSEALATLRDMFAE